jgi:hypothetical protein
MRTLESGVPSSLEGKPPSSHKVDWVPGLLYLRAPSIAGYANGSSTSMVGILEMAKLLGVFMAGVCFT